MQELSSKQELYLANKQITIKPSNQFEESQLISINNQLLEKLEEYQDLLDYANDIKDALVNMDFHFQHFTHSLDKQVIKKFNILRLKYNQYVFHQISTPTNKEEHTQEKQKIIEQINYYNKKIAKINDELYALSQELKSFWVYKKHSSNIIDKSANIIRYNWRLYHRYKNTLSINSPHHLRNKQILDEIQQKICCYIDDSGTAQVVNQEHRIFIASNKVILDCGSQAKLAYIAIIKNQYLSEEIKSCTFIASMKGEDHAFIVIFDKNKITVNIEYYNYIDDNTKFFSQSLTNQDLQEAVIFDSWLKYVSFNKIPHIIKTRGYLGNGKNYIDFINQEQENQYFIQQIHKFELYKIDDVSKDQSYNHWQKYSNVTLYQHK